MYQQQLSGRKSRTKRQNYKNKEDEAAAKRKKNTKQAAPKLVEVWARKVSVALSKEINKRRLRKQIYVMKVRRMILAIHHGCEFLYVKLS